VKGHIFSVLFRISKNYVLNDILFDLLVVRAKMTFARNNHIFKRPFALNQNYVYNHIFFRHFGYAGSLMMPRALQMVLLGEASL
jgi:hypothetical protein